MQIRPLLTIDPGARLVVVPIAQFEALCETTTKLTQAVACLEDPDGCPVALPAFIADARATVARAEGGPS